jgi:hypothetical protein
VGRSIRQAARQSPCRTRTRFSATKRASGVKTAKTIGVTIPVTLLDCADEVIE